jgi:ABC-type amino acid transport substrate-binding protein
MRNLQTVKRYSVLVWLVVTVLTTDAQVVSDHCNSWQQVQANKRGIVTALWDDIEPFIYVNKEGVLSGVEYEIMESFRSYLKIKYNIELTVEWKRAGSFDSIYYKVKNSPCSGVFGWSYYSITQERQKEVQFSPPYMPDLNVLVTNNLEPMYASSQEFISRLKEMKAYTQPYTTMGEDIESLRTNFFPGLPVTTMQQDYDIMRAIAADAKGFGYVPLSVYIVALQKGIKVKRQNVLSNSRQGFAAVLPLHADWKPVVDEYFSTGMFRTRAGAIVSKYLGSQVKDLVFESGQPVAEEHAALDLVSLEKEIVTKRLMDTALEVQQHRSTRNILIILFIFVIILSLVLYSRFHTKQRLNRELRRQKDQIAQMNQLLKLKILQARMNPHFLFNSLNAVQYFIAGDDKKASLQYIGRFSAFLRKVINFGDELCISAQEEAELLKEYLWLEHCRFRDKFEYEIKVGAGAGNAGILPLLSHTLVEHALYKGVLNLDAHRKGKLVVEFVTQDNQLLVIITDNGTTRDDAYELEKKKGLVNGDDNMLQRRIELFNAQSSRKIVKETRVAEDVSGTRNTIATLQIPQPLFDHAIFE